MSLKYRIVKSVNGNEVTFKAEPNEWACVVTGRVGSNFGDEGVNGIGWSSGGRKWTTDEARAFFRAGMRVMNRLDKEMKRRQEENGNG